MVKPSTSPAGETGQSISVGDQTPTLAEVQRVVGGYMRSMYPAVHNIRVLGDVTDADGHTSAVRLPIPVAAPPADLKSAILHTLGKLRAGEWMKGRNVAWDIDEDIDHKGGSFKRAVSELIEDDKIESDRTLGYRLKTRVS